MKLCKDCNYFRTQVPTTRMQTLPDYSDPKCGHPSALTATDMVFGHQVFYTCKAMRESKAGNSCGPLAVYFDPISERRQPT